MDAAVRSPLSADIRCAGVHQRRMGNRRYEQFELSCCMVFATASTLKRTMARMLRLSHGGGVLDPINGFDSVARRDAGLLVRRLLMGSVLGHR